MIAALHGEVRAAGAGWVVISVSGVGFRVEVPGRLRAVHPGDSLELLTHLVVREDSLTLYGFETAEELEVFGVLLGVSGVGPRSALGVLTELTPAQIAHAVANEDEQPFRKVPGIGPKTAKLIAVQLAGKLDPRIFAGHSNVTADAAGDAAARPDAHPGAAATVTQGLVGLGYAESQAVAAVRDALAAGAEANESALLRAALALLQAPRMSTSYKAQQ